MQLPVHHIGTPFTVLNEVDSTNNYAMGLVHAKQAEHGLAVFARNQTAGKGQRGKEWESEPGENLVLSVVLSPSAFGIVHPFAISLVASMASYDLLFKYVLDESSIKWPNDIYWRDRKAGGILIENVIKGGALAYSIVGIGININQVRFSPDIPNPVSFRQITGKHFDAEELAKELCQCIQNRWEQLLKSGEANLHADLNAILYGKGTIQNFKKENIQFNALVESVDTEGKLLLKRGMVESFSVGEIEWQLSSHQK